MKKKSSLEKVFKEKFFARLLEEYGVACRVTSNDPRLVQGIPDATVTCIFENGAMWWKDLEFKRTAGSSRQPNQEYYIRKNGLFVFPENEEEVLSEIRSEISEARRRACIPKPK